MTRSTKRQEVAIVCMLAIISTAVALWAHSLSRDTPMVITSGNVQRRHDADRLRQVEADTQQALYLCGYARSEAALADSKAQWLRAHLATLYRRLGQQRMAAGLATWPGGVSQPMDGAR